MPAVNIKREFFNHDAQAGGFFPITHTNPGFDIDKFIGETGQNYLIEGIRGTGKTHILKMVNEKCLDTFGERRILPVYVSLASVSEWVENDLSLFRIHLYANIVLTSIDVLEKNRGKVELAGNPEGLKALKRIAQMFGLNEQENLDKIISKLKDIHKTLLSKLTYNPDMILEKESDTLQNLGKVKGNAKGQVFAVQMTFEEMIKTIEETEIQFVGKNLAHENASTFIISFFYQLKQVLNHRYSFVLLDECSEVSKEAQVEVFRLLKLIRGAFGDDTKQNTAYFCASVYPSPVTYYPSKNLGDSFNFDAGHDAIMEYLHLDELSDDYIGFYEELTRKRISFAFGKPFERSSPLDIFENERAFILASYFSNGIVRRYIEILKHAYDNLCQRTAGDSTEGIERIAPKDVEEGVQVVVANQILAQNKLTVDDFRIVDDIVNRISWRNKKNETENESKRKDKKIPANVYFTVSRTELFHLGRLIIQGALHDKGRTRLKKYHKEGGTRGALIMLDLAVAFHDGAIDRIRAYDIFLKDLRKNAKSGYLWCQDFKLPIPK
ncbi:MAG: hypothetical protein CVV03_02615 [Firmicutes bacterium HGW-Firmicutes-8]|nr:MAG: hypothetical protein CVV03_02615 [Firmicutes bacterium HGW-Firmicutes-8]